MRTLCRYVNDWKKNVFLVPQEWHHLESNENYSGVGARRMEKAAMPCIHRKRFEKVAHAKRKESTKTKLVVKKNGIDQLRTKRRYDLLTPFHLDPI